MVMIHTLSNCVQPPYSIGKTNPYLHILYFQKEIDKCLITSQLIIQLISLDCLAPLFLIFLNSE